MGVEFRKWSQMFDYFKPKYNNKKYIYTFFLLTTKSGKTFTCQMG